MDSLADRLNAAFQYQDGWLIWKAPTSNAVEVGDVAETASDKDYILVVFEGVSYKAHRLIWIMHYGDIPEDFQIDHRNGIRYDNRIENLRIVTNQQNALNRHSTLSSTGYRGVTLDKSGRFRSRVKVNGKHITLGSFDTAVEAHNAYLKARGDLRGLPV